MVCEFMEANQRRAAIEAARKALLEKQATAKKNLLSGKMEIVGMEPAYKNGMADSCILAGLAAQAATDPALNAFFTSAGLRPGELVKSHQHSHQHDHAH